MNAKRCQSCRRILLWSTVAFLGTLLVGILVPTKWHYSPQSDCTVPIYISSVNQFHAEIIVPVRHSSFDWRQQLNLEQLGKYSDRYRYLSFGWGDRAFFMNASYDPITFFDVLFLPGPTAMHVWAHTHPPLTLGSAFEVKALHISRAQYLKLAEFINGSFQRNTKGNTRYIQPGLYPDSGFFEAEGTYSILRTCNTWTADALRKVDINTPLWTGLAPAIMAQLRGNCPR